ncbi:helix-turn-helix transcriptional regulator [Hydrogenophaga aquatica]
MSKQHFLASASAHPPIVPPERWLLAFPDGQWSNWSTLQATVRPGDVVWVPVAHADWKEKVAALLQLEPLCRVVVASAVPYDAEGLRALNAGARGYCHLMAIPELMREVAEVVSHGGLWVGPELVQRLMTATREAIERSPNAQVPEADLSLLSDREAQVARAVAAGKSNKEVADLLHISERTVKAHLGSVFEKLGVRDRVQLVLHLSHSNTQQG